MPRPNKGTDLLLIETGKEVLLSEGISGLTINKICKKAHVNPGMFVYNFKSKEEFLNKILNELHQELFAKLLKGVPGETGFERLYNGLYMLCVISSKYPKLMIQCTNDTLSGDETMIKAFLEHIAKHMQKIFTFFKEAQKEGKITKKIDMPDFFLTAWPSLIYSSMSPDQIMEIFPEEDRKDPKLMVSDEAIRERVRRCLAYLHPDVYDNL